MSITEPFREAYRAAAEAFDVVVTFDVGGLERRFAERAIVVPYLNTSIQVDGGLVADPAIPQLMASVRDASVSVGQSSSVSVQTKSIRWFKTLRSSVPLQRMRAEIALLPDGGAWEDRLVVYLGLLRQPSWDKPTGVVSFQLADSAPDADGRLPDRIISENETFASAPERSRGELVPILYGAEVIEVAGLAILEATDDNRILIAGHHVRTDASLITVHRDDADGDAGDLSKTAVNGSDDTGRAISWVVLTDVEYWQDNPTDTKPFSFTLDAPGIRGRSPGSLGAGETELRFLGEVMLDMLQRFSGLAPDRIDAESFKHLDSSFQIEVSVQVTQDRKVTEWINSLIQDLPVAVAWVGGRLTAIVGALAETPAVVTKLRMGHELIALSRRFEEESIDGIFNDVVVRYSYRNRESRYRKSIELNTSNDAEARRSVERYGERASGGFIDLWQVQDDASANRVAREYLTRGAHLRTAVQYIAETRAVSHLRPLDVVEITDEDNEVMEHLFIVEDIAQATNGTTALGIASWQELELHG